MSKLIRKIITAAKAPKPVGPYNQAVQVGNTIYVSGVLGIDVNTSKLVAGGAPAEANQALKNLGEILAAADSSYKNVVKTTIFLADIGDFSAVNETYKQCDPYPARSTFQVGKLPMEARVEIEVIAVSGELVDRV
ncbi:2-iminobutanoate/2-iminopropanoate deaminase isoform X2 [Nilaparvata lugens]|uniref:2-iminobutanoate/2-iminopropanoate deaminase isoform X2 n=1 Tax=Nilaparvata lugens TaxID=108931 RepID=UPI00193D1E7F|nr:2-iminobutanoate/2-iminopropanoate deaminase isoform X2 [Nilaparvata lugens]